MNNVGQTVLSAMDGSRAVVSVNDRSPIAARELVGEAARLARQLQAHGTGEQEPVILLIENTPSDLVGFLGLWQARCVVVPCHVATPPDAIKRLTARTGARHLVAGNAVSRIADLPPPARTLLDTAALIVFTSGSTGKPKGVVIGHDGLLFKLEVLSELLPIGTQDDVLVALQLTFIFGIWVSLLSLMAGASLRLMPRMRRDELRMALRCSTTIATVPTVLRDLCIDQPVPAPRLRTILTGGEIYTPALAAQITRDYPDVKSFDLFGLTETGSCDFCLKPDDLPAGAGSIGRPTAGVTFRITPSLGAGHVTGAGELRIRTPARMLGYLDDPELTMQALDGEYVRTGDLALERPDGFVQLIGRIKDIISRGGLKVAPAEVEALLASHPDVAAVVAFGVPHITLGEAVHAMIVAHHTSLDAPTLRMWAAPRIERYKIPDVFHFVEALPSGPTAKVDRMAARASIIARQHLP